MQRRIERGVLSVTKQLEVGPQSLGEEATTFAVQVETAATHITMNPVTMSMQCRSARLARDGRA